METFVDFLLALAMFLIMLGIFLEKQWYVVVGLLIMVFIILLF